MSIKLDTNRLDLIILDFGRQTCDDIKGYPRLRSLPALAGCSRLRRSPDICGCVIKCAARILSHNHIYPLRGGAARVLCGKVPGAEKMAIDKIAIALYD